MLRLFALVPPPPVPVDAHGDWVTVEAALGLRLPADYKALVGAYGSGEFDEVSLLTPFAPNDSANLIARARELLPTFGPFRESWPEDYPHRLYPEPGGLLEWGSHGAGHQLCWQTGGDPDAWPVVLVAEDGGTFRYEMGLADLLFGYLSGALEVEPLLPAPPRPWFDTFRARISVSARLGASERPFEERLRVLRELLAPTADRRNYEGQANTFKAVERDWLVTYEDTYAHQLRIACPPEDADAARAMIVTATAALTAA